MQPVEDFLHEYFRNRTELFRESCDGWESHAQRFFAPLYEPYNRQKKVADSEAERIISVSSADGLAEVITTGFAGAQWPFRYRLSAIDGGWRIKSIEIECGNCHGSRKAKDGTSDCWTCKGVGWMFLGDLTPKD